MAKGGKGKPSLNNGIIYGYGLGEFGYNFFITFLAYYLSYFLTNIAGFSMLLAGTMVTLTNVIKWVTMPIAGTIIDAKALKGGRYRPWMVVGALLMLVGGTACFFKFPMRAGIGYAVVYLIFFAICYIGYGLMWVSYRALMDPMSKNPQDKVALSTSSSQMGALARIIYAFGATNIVGLFASAAMGYFVTTLIFNVILVLSIVAVFFITKKYDNDETMASARQKMAKQKLTGKEIVENPLTGPCWSSSLRCSSVSRLLLSYLHYWCTI